ncbi:MAG: DNA-binding protein [Oscillospiraceae bacterium]|nr:DNA-binding protein [Oscillospiraceae bacterium]
MDIEKELQFCILLDFYGDMLTEKQRDVVDLYYNEDLSLSEIAEHENITRQGVRDSIKRGEQTMLELEEKFHLAERSRTYSAIMSEVAKLAEDIRNECAYCGNPKGIVKRADYLTRLTEEYKDLF